LGGEKREAVIVAVTVVSSTFGLRTRHPASIAWKEERAAL